MLATGLFVIYGLLRPRYFLLRLGCGAHGCTVRQRTEVIRIPR